jgi:RNA polymerase sigma factor (sigma-70 family)
MENCLSQAIEADSSIHFWALYWYKQWQTDRMAYEHLAAYLQKPCYEAAKKVYWRFSSLQYRLEDYFQIAFAQTKDLLKSFKPTQGNHLSTYATSFYEREIKEYLRLSKEVNICSDWSLLRQISKKQLNEALQNAGLGTKKIESYLLVWRCYKLLYIPPQPRVNRGLQKPTQETWEALAQQYNLDALGNQVGTEQIEAWLLKCAQIVRTYLYPRFKSIDQPISGEDDARELGEILPELRSPSYFDTLIDEISQQERQSLRDRVRSILLQSICQLPAKRQELLQLYYGDRQTQQQLAKHFGIHQTTIGRNLREVKKLLLKQLTQWIQEELHISITSNILNDLSNFLEFWLDEYYRSS